MAMSRIMGTTALALIMTAGTASAQEYFRRDRYEAVTDRYHEDFSPEDVRLGAFLLDSELGLGVVADDNVFADLDDEQEDVIFTIAPDARLTSNWSRHQISARVQAEHREFADIDSESSTDVLGELRGRLDVNRELEFSGRVFAADENEPRTDVSALDIFEEPVSRQTLGGEAGALWTASRLRAEGSAQARHVEYDDVPLVDGGSRDLDFRSFDEYSARTRLSYAVSPDLAVFAQAQANTRDYDAATPVGDQSGFRDSEGYSIQVGTNFELPALLRGDIAVGYLEDNKDDPLFDDTSGLAVDGTLTWFPTELTTFSVDAFRRAVDPGLNESGSALSTGISARADHELLRNVLLFAQAGYDEQDFEDINRDDETTDLRLGATYKMNKRLHFDAFVRRTDRTSNFDPAEFERNIFGLALTIHP